MGLIDKIKGVFGGEAADTYHLHKADDHWRFAKPKAERSIRNFDTKNEGLTYASDYLTKKGGNLIVYKEDGEIQEERNYPID